TNEKGEVVEFEEKPKSPKNNKASMGIYIFTWEKLRQYLVTDEINEKSSNDFGKNIIPTMLKDGQRMMAYDFEGYWKDVGTIESLWEANMDLLKKPVPIALYDKSWRIYGRNPSMPPHFIQKDASVINSLVTEGCNVCGSIEHSVLFSGVTVEAGAKIKDSVVMPNVTVARGAVINRAIIAEGAYIGPGAVVGKENGNIAVVGQLVDLPAGFIVDAGTQVEQKDVHA
ncbi:MAG: glucose-1-phosphate adenylyltransferase, partial [Clostridiales bacterium]|nr:glucose-1-phosphate adenylyltransferase [Clostridiales bacterium]